eukprot:Gb_40276 [translate_table: standard]
MQEEPVIHLLQVELAYKPKQLDNIEPS